MTKSRQGNRVTLNCDVEFKRHGDARYRVELIDLSPQGCCLSPPIRVDRGDSISLRIRDMAAIHGQVAWVDGWKAGVQFNQPFHPAVFDSVVKRLRGGAAA